MDHIRSYGPEDEIFVLELVNQTRNLPFGLEQFRQAEGRRNAAPFFARLVVEFGGRVIGFGSLEAQTAPLGRPGWMMASVAVDEAHRTQGHGRTLWNTLEAMIDQRNPVGLEAEVRDSDPASRGWAERRGFSMFAHRFESVLDLEGFDPRPFEAMLEQVRASGIRFFTSADVPGEENLRRFYELFVRLSAADPSVTGDPGGPVPPFEAFKVMASDPFQPPEGIILAADGERWIGVSVLVWLGADRQDIHTRFTGVDPEYRGRGLALALKLLSARYAATAGARRMRTSNDSRNGPILAVNQKLGYDPLPGVWRMERRAKP